MEMQTVQMLLAPDQQPANLDRRLYLAQQEYEKIGWQLRTVGVFLSLPPLDLVEVGFLPGMVVLRLAGQTKAEADEILARCLGQESIAESFNVDGVLVRTEQRREL